MPTEAEQIARIKKVKKSRNARYTTQKCTLESSIYELHRAIRRLDSEIKKLNLTEAADREREKRKEWPGLAKATEEEKAQKERERQERRLGRDMKERRLASTKLDLEKKQALLDEAETENVAADLVDEEEIRALEARIEARERREKEERERLEKIMKQQQEQRERREREEGEARKKQQAEQQAAEEKRKAEEASRKAEEASRKAEEAKIKELEEELERLRKEMRDAEEKRQAEERASEQQTKADVPPSTEKAPSTCYHGSWWTKINEHAACPECNHVWHWLLECPNCKIQRCPPCKAEECGDYWYR